MKREVKKIQYNCNWCDEIIINGAECQLAIGDNTSFRTHHFCDEKCFSFFIEDKQGVHTTRIRNLSLTVKFGD